MLSASFKFWALCPAIYFPRIFTFCSVFPGFVFYIDPKISRCGLLQLCDSPKESRLPGRAQSSDTSMLRAAFLLPFITAWWNKQTSAWQEAKIISWTQLSLLRKLLCASMHCQDLVFYQRESYFCIKHECMWRLFFFWNSLCSEQGIWKGPNITTNLPFTHLLQIKQENKRERNSK